MNEKRKEVIGRILEAIRQGDIVKKGRLPSERDLAKHIGEQRTIVREALISLEAIGVVEIREKQGIFVHSSSEIERTTLLHEVSQWPADIVSQAMEMRQLLEPAAAGLAAVRRRDSDVQKLAQCLEKMKALLNETDSESSRQAARWNTIFHSIIVSATNSSYLEKTYEGIISSIEHGMSLMRYRMDPHQHGGRQVTFRDHDRLFRAIRDKDSSKAERVAEEHIWNTIKAMTTLGGIVSSSDLYIQGLAGRLRFESVSSSNADD